jgi:hypothetical protein
MKQAMLLAEKQRLFPERFEALNVMKIASQGIKGEQSMEK